MAMEYVLRHSPDVVGDVDHVSDLVSIAGKTSSPFREFAVNPDTGRFVVPCVGVSLTHKATKGEETSTEKRR